MDTIRYRMYSYSTAVSVRYFHEVEEVTRNRYTQRRSVELKHG